MHSFSRAVGVLLFIALGVRLSPVVAAEVGTTAGQFEVTPSGSATYTIPVTIPPGTAGLQPSVSITYDSAGDNGLLGAGFSLDGLSAITRCQTALEPDGFIDGVDFDESDRFCLDGQRLVVVAGTYGAPNAEYRTEIESFSKIVSIGGTANDPGYFRVWTKSGLIMEYGATADSRWEAVTAPPGQDVTTTWCEPPPDEHMCWENTVPGFVPAGYGKARAWGVNRVSDTSTNYYTVSYSENATTGETLPQAIQYTGNVSTGISPNATIVLVYEDRIDVENRSDVTTGFFAGALVTQSKRLARIDTLLNGGTVREYRLKYNNLGHGNGSRLETVTECAGSSCLNPTTFWWTSPSQGTGGYISTGDTSGISHFVDSSPLAPYDIARVLYGDFDADGLTDIYMVPRSTTSASGTIHYGNPNGVFGSAQPGAPHLATTDKSVSELFGTWTGVDPYLIKTADLNADGYTDLYEMRPDQPSRVHINQKNGTFTTIAGPAHARANTLAEHTRYPNRLRLVDMNGDGLTDLLWIGGFNCPVFLCTTSIYLNQGGGVLGPTSVNGPQVPISGNEEWATVNVKAVKTGDFNGDGLTDIYRINVQSNIDSSFGGTMFLQQSNGSFLGYAGAPHNYAPPSASRASNHVDKVQIADFNGDGVSDIIRINNTGPISVWLARGDTTFSPTINGPSHALNTSDTGLEARDVARLKLGDINADGRTDFYIVKNIGGSTDQGEIYLSHGHYYDAGSGIYQLDFEYKPGSPHLVSNDSVTAALRGLARFNFIELDGNGIPELYDNRAWGNTVPAVVRHFDFYAGDRVTSIVNGLGASIGVLYRPLSWRFDMLNWATYTKGTGATYPLMDVQGPMYVAAQSSASDPVGGERNVTYEYAGLRLHWRGRGLLGFQTHVVKDAATGLVETTTFRQDFPYIGMPSASVTGLADGRELADSSTSYASQPLGSGTSLRHFVYAQSETVRGYEINGTNPIVKSTVTANEYSESVQYGNLKRSTVSVYAGPVIGAPRFETVNVNDYGNDASLWHLGRLTQSTVTRTSATAPTHPPRTSTFDYYFNTTGLLKSETIEPSGQWLRKEYERDDHGNITRTTITGADIALRETTTEYLLPRRQFVRKIINPLGHAETHDYDHATGALTALTGPNNRTTRWQYDAFGRKTRETRPDNTWTSIARQWCAGSSPACIAGSLFKLVTEESTGAKAIAEFDSLERQVASQALAFDGSWTRQLTQYNAKGQVYRKSAPHFAGDPYWTSLTYDLAGRVLQEDAPLDQNQATGRLTSYAYAGLETTQTNAKNQTTTNKLNALGKVEWTRDSAQSVTEYFYDAFDNLVRTVDPAGNEVAMTYDVRGQKLTMADPDMGNWSYTYNALGELKTQTDAKLQTVVMNYDLLGRMVSRVEGSGGSEVTTWTYDLRWKGALDSVSSPGYQREHYYDALGRPSIVDHTIGSSLYSYSYTFDAQSRPLSLTYPSGFWVANEYSATGHQHRVSTSASALFDVITCSTATVESVMFPSCALSNPAATTEVWHLDTTDAWGHQTLSTLGNGADTVNSFDAANGRLGTILTTVAGKPDVQSLNYTWDALGNLDGRVDQVQGGLSETFEYDGLNRLTHAQVSTGGDAALREMSIDYDDIGNITSKSDVGTYAYAARPHAVTATTGLRAAVYAYDANGNQLSGAGRTLTWTHHNRPASIVRGANSNAFTYGPARERIRQDSTQLFAGGGTLTKSTVYVGGLYESESTGLPTPVMAKHYIQAGGRVVAISTRPESGTGIGTFQYLHHDHLGSVDKLTDDDGDVADSFSFDAFGKRRALNWLNDPTDSQLSQQHATDKGYTSQQQLDGVALIHYGGRVYDPILGRFTSADPIVQAPTDIQSYNRYAYVRNNPLSLTDPTGFSWVSKQTRRLRHEAARWEGDFRHEIRRPNSLLGPAIVIASAVACLPAAGACSAPTAAAVAAGTAAGVARAQGADGMGTFKAAFIAGWTAGALSTVGQAYAAGSVQDLLTHGFVGAFSTAAQGGRSGAGFVTGIVSAAVPVPENSVGAAIVSAAVGGTASVIGGGEFANGAVTGAFSYLFARAVRPDRAREVQVPDELKRGVEATFDAHCGGSLNVDNVRVIENSRWANFLDSVSQLLTPWGVRATTQPGTIHLSSRVPAPRFFASPELILEEYYHVLVQWDTGAMTNLSFVMHASVWETPAQNFAVDNAALYQSHLGGP